MVSGDRGHVLEFPQYNARPRRGGRLLDARRHDERPGVDAARLLQRRALTHRNPLVPVQIILLVIIKFQAYRFY